MGWQDAPIVPEAPVAQPAWMRAPVVGAQPAPADIPHTLDNTIPTIGGGLQNPDGTPYVAPPQEPAQPSSRWADRLADFGHDLGISPITDPAIGLGETALSGVTNLFGKGAGGVTGIADMVGNLVANPFRDQPIDPMDSAANTSRAIEDFFTYHPARPGQALMEPVQEGLGAVMRNLPDDPVSQTAVPAFTDLAASLAPVKPGVTAGVGALERAAPRPSVAPGEGLGQALADLRAAGYPVRPSDVRRFNPGKEVPGTTREKFAPEAARERTVEKAQVKTQEIAGKELGLKPGERLDENWDKLRAPEIETYRLAEDVAAQKDMLPELEAALADGAVIVRRELLDEGGEPSITRTISALRRRATKELNDERPEVNDRGYDTLAAAERIEKAFGKQLEHVGEPQMLDRYQAAREKLAKIHDYESISTAGIVDAAKAAKLNQKFQGRLTGGLKMIATAGEYLPKATTSTMRAADPGAIGVPHSKPGLIAKATGFISSKIPGLDVTTPEFQAKHFGAEAPPDFISQYGRRDVPAPEVVPQQELGLGEPMVLKPPPGISRPLVEDTPELGSVMIDEPLFTNEPRTVGFPDLNFQDVMALIDRETGKAPVPRDLGTALAEQPAPEMARSASIRTRGAAEDVPEGRATAANDNFGAEAGRDLPSAARKTLDDLSNAPSREELLASLDSMALQAAALPKPVMRSLHDLRELLRDKGASPREILDAKDGLESDLRQFLGE